MLSAATWNTRSLLHHVPATAQAKDTQLTRLLATHDVVLLQEVRGDHDMVHRAAMRHRATHACWTSTSPTCMAGGLIVFVSQSIAAMATQVESAPLVPGRVLRLTLCRSHIDRLDLVNVHNESLTSSDRRRIQNDLRACSAARRATSAATSCPPRDPTLTQNMPRSPTNGGRQGPHPPSRPRSHTMGAAPARPAGNGPHD